MFYSFSKLITKAFRLFGSFLLHNISPNLSHNMSPPLPVSPNLANGLSPNPLSWFGLVRIGLVRVGLGWCEILHGVLVHKTRPSSGLGSCDRFKLSWFILEDCLKDNISYLDPTSQPTLFSLSFSLLPRRGFHRVRSQLVWAEFFTNNPIICNMLTFIQYLFHPIIQPLHQIQNILIMLHLTLSDLIWTHLVQSDWAWSLLTWLEPPWSQWPNLNLSDPIYHCLNPL